MTVFLVRHAPHALQHRVLVGRAPGVALAEGADETLGALAVRFATERLDAVIASPIERAQATAAAIAAAADLDVETDERLTEVDLGDWSMTAFEDLDGRADWAVWCAAKAVARPPAGESLMEVQVRMVAAVEAARRARPGGRVALVGHGDPLKTLLAYALGSPLDRVDGFDLDPGSVSAVATGGWGLKVLFVNERVR